MHFLGSEDEVKELFLFDYGRLVLVDGTIEAKLLQLPAIEVVQDEVILERKSTKEN